MRRKRISKARSWAFVAAGVAAGLVLVAAIDSRAGGAASAGQAASAAGDPVAGRTVFRSSGCGGCHVLAAAGAKGRVGPNLDTVKPSAVEVAAIVRRGGGTMPSFSGRLSAKAIADVAAFVAKATGAGRSRRPSTGPALFQRYCSGCHTLAAAGTTGKSGPNLDREHPDFEDVIKAVLEGEDEMPSFRGRLSRNEIAKIATFVSQAARGRGEDDDD